MEIVFDRLPSNTAANYFQDGWGRYMAFDWASDSWKEAMTSDASIEGPYIKCARYFNRDVVEKVRAAVASAPFPNLLFVWDSNPLIVGLISSDKPFPAGGESKFTTLVHPLLAEAWPELSSARS